jgi:hypothetical protein
VSADGAREFLDGLDARAQGLAAPLVDELPGPGRGVVIPKLLELFLQQVRAHALQVVAQQVAQPEPLLVGQILDLLRRKASKTTFNRDRGNLWQVGGEIIRRRYDNPDLKRLPIDQLIRQLVEEDGGPLIWPRISETEQNAIDATCRKLYRFFNQSTAAERPKSTHKFR